MPLSVGTVQDMVSLEPKSEGQESEICIHSLLYIWIKGLYCTPPATHKNILGGINFGAIHARMYSHPGEYRKWRRRGGFVFCPRSCLSEKHKQPFLLIEAKQGKGKGKP